jgi:hypothetical protein
MVKLLGAVICRWSALTIPLVSVPSRPNGLPIASTASDRDTVRITETDRLEERRGCIDLDHGEIRRGIGSDERGSEGRAVPEADRDGAGVGDDVLVRNDVSVAVQNEPGTLRARCRVAEGRAAGRGSDLHDSFDRLVVDLPDGDAIDGGSRLGARHGDLPHDGLRFIFEQGVRGCTNSYPEAKRGNETGQDECCAR